MKKNVDGQCIYLFAFDETDLTEVTGDSANMSAFISKDGAAEAAATNALTELDATNAPGVYILELAQAETNCDHLCVSATSTTANVQVRPEFRETTEWTFDGIDFDDLLIAVMAVLFGVSAATATGSEFMERDGTTAKVEITHDSAGNRTESTIN